MSPGDKVRVHHKDATGKTQVFNGTVVRQVADKSWSVNIGAVAIVFTEENIHAIEKSEAEKVYGGGSPQSAIC